MADIEVKKSDHGDSYGFQVTVRERGGESRHRVTLQKDAGRFVAVSTGSQASSRLLSMVGANGLLVLEQATGVLPAGSERPALLLDDSWL